MSKLLINIVIFVKILLVEVIRGIVIILDGLNIVLRLTGKFK